MSKGIKKKSQAQARILELQMKQRNGILIAVAAFVCVAAVIGLKLFFQYQLNAAWAGTEFASLGLFIIALIGAGFAGWGTRNWRKARDQIKIIERKYKL